MKGKTGLSALALSVLLLTGCSTDKNDGRQQAIDAVPASFAAGAIALQLRAEPGLNKFNELPNSCTVLVLQTKDNAALDNMLKNPVVLKSLFAGTGSEVEGGLLQVDRYVMMPGQTNTLHIDRAENTRNLGVVAGYYPFPTKQHMFSMAIPVTAQSEGWWKPVWKASLAPTVLSITLGSESIVNTSIPATQTPPQAVAEENK